MALESILASLGTYFGNPIGLAALAALLPLAILYLIKREPDEQVMPSFMFFHDDDEGDTMKSSYRKLMRNLVLLLHILAITVFALAFAEPLMEGAGQPEHSVLVLDHSGSMSGDLASAKSFLKSNTGDRNTVIAVDDDVEVRAEKVSEGEARTVINNIELSETGTDIASGLRNAQRYEGSFFIASDLDQTVTDSGTESLVEELRSSGDGVRLMADLERRNSWGIIDIDAGTDNTTVDVKNFESTTNTVTLSHSGGEQEVEIEGKSVESVTVDSSTGRNTVSLSGDGYETDNTAYFSVPEDQTFDVAFMADEENPYLMKTFELIEFADIEYYGPPVENLPESDMYIIGDTDRMISETLNRISDDVNDGAAMVVFGSQSLENLQIDNLPVENRDGEKNATVTIQEPVNINLGELRINNLRRTRGETLTPGSNALVRSEYGQGEVLVYNIPDSSFNQNFLYPVFWKEISDLMLERTAVEDLNYQTGTAINEESVTYPSGETDSGRTVLKTQGFYNTSRGIVAANMLNEDESLRDRIDVGSGSTNASSGSKASIQDYVIMLLLALIIVETGYLYRIGDLR